jgi:hypothetical protein
VDRLVHDLKHMADDKVSLNVGATAIPLAVIVGLLGGGIVGKSNQGL